MLRDPNIDSSQEDINGPEKQLAPKLSSSGIGVPVDEENKNDVRLMKSDQTPSTESQQLRA